VPFILDELALPFFHDNDENIDTLTRKILEVSEKYADEAIWKQLSYKAKWIAEKYTSERWMEQVRAFLPERTRKILLVTDYTTTLGGIETHVQNIAALLEQHGYKVQTFGWDVGR